MTTDIHAVALVPDRAGDASDLVRGFQNNGPDIGAAQQFERCRETCRTGTDDDGCF